VGGDTGVRGRDAGCGGVIQGCGGDMQEKFIYSTQALLTTSYIYGKNTKS